MDALRQFENFRNEYIKQSGTYDSYRELVRNPPEADCYIVGSDTVWNPYIKKIHNGIRVYFLDFGDHKIKRFSYAASFATKRVANDFIDKITPLLKKFDYVSVREKSGVAICRRCGVEAEWVPDPTLLLGADDYRSLIAVESMPSIKKPYCLLYMLSNPSDFSIQAVYDWAKGKNIDVVYIAATGRYDDCQQIYATIPEWIYYIDNAEYVITNSFHGTIFSLIFKKQFGTILLKRDYVTANERFYSLFEILNMETRFINDSFSILDTHINWDTVHDKFKKIQDSCTLRTFLQ
jgi:hypothetical protein